MEIGDDDNTVVATKKGRGRKGGVRRKRVGRRARGGVAERKRGESRVGDQDFGIVGDQPESALPRDNLILHLRIQPGKEDNEKTSHATEQELLQYNPEMHEPSPYEHSASESCPCPVAAPATENSENTSDSEQFRPYIREMDTHYRIADSHGDEHDVPVRESVSDATPKISKSIHENLSTFNVSSDAHVQSQAPSGFPTTNICCWWCCHAFNWSPFMIPIKRVADKFDAIGCFCMPECATSYIFWSGTRNGDPWRQYSWLHEIVHKTVNGESRKIRHALPRETLKMFGGPYTIEKFRERSDNYHLQVKITSPPINPTNGVTQEMLVENMSKKKYVPLDSKRIEKATEQLRLKRIKKKDTENTLETFMNLRISA